MNYFEIICAYLPFNVKVTVVNTGEEKILHPHLLGDERNFIFKPFLRDIGAVSQEIEHNGKRITPLLEIAGLAGVCSPSDFYVKDDFIAQHKTSEFHFTFIDSPNNVNFYNKNSNEWKDFATVSQTQKIFRMLHVWHFDLYGAIRSGIAQLKTD